MFDQCIYFNTSALARRLDREWADAFAEFGLTPPQAFMLRAVLDRPGLLQSELSKELSIARPTATRALDFLEAKGYIERRATPGDGREVAVWPTPKATRAKVALNEASGIVTARLKKMLGSAEFGATVTRIRETLTALG
jgi:MarR family transcriptional regulator, temperature-dependent positive regulator of motility